MRTVIYARKSTESEDRQVQSLEDQLKALRQLAEREGIYVAEIFQEACSAKKPGARPEFERLMKEVDFGKVTGVLTWSISRLSRNPVDGGRIAYALQSGKLDYIKTTERTYRPDDNALLLSIENGMATAYLQDLSRNVTRGMVGKAERGWHVCKAPLGYKNDLESREIVPDPVRFPLVRLAWDMLLEGQLTVNEIHREIAKRGLSASSRKRSRPPISKAMTHKLFTNRFYMGEVNFMGRTYSGKHAPMVTPDEFDAAQNILRQRSKARKPEVPKRLAFHGALRCGTCGCLIIGDLRVKHYPNTGRTAEYLYYHCSGSKGCSKRAIREEDLRSAVEPILLNARLPRAFADWIKSALIQRVEAEGCQSAEDQARLQAEINKEEGRMKQLSVMRMDGEIDGQEFLSLRQELQARIQLLSQTLRDAADATSKILSAIYRKLDVAVQINELLGNDYDASAVGHALRIADASLLNLSPFDFRIDPLLAKIATFEPLRNGSEKPKVGDLVPINSHWWTLVDDLRTLATG